MKSVKNQCVIYIRSKVKELNLTKGETTYVVNRVTNILRKLKISKLINFRIIVNKVDEVRYIESRDFSNGIKFEGELILNSGKLINFGITYEI